jgi:hypothetical protein
MIMQGNDVLLSFKNINKKGHLVTPTSLELVLFKFGVDKSDSIGDPIDPDLVELTVDLVDLTNTSIGSYSYTLSTDEDTQVGIYTYCWVASGPGYSTRAFGTYTIIANPDLESDVATTFNFVLDVNSIYQIDLSSIWALDGSVLQSYSSFFTSRYSPMYTSYYFIASKYNSLIENMNPDIVNYLIWEASVEADALVSAGHICNDDYLLLAKKNFVESVVGAAIIRNYLIAPNGLLSKSLGDLRVAYRDNSQYLDKTAKDLDREAAEWERVLNARACIGYKGSLGSSYAVLGSARADRAAIGRQIRDAIGADAMANTKARPSYSLRFQHAYESPYLRYYSGYYDIKGAYYE